MNDVEHHQEVDFDGRAGGTDPVCGMHVEADASTPPATFEGRIYWFCSAHCHEVFTVDPQRYHRHPVAH